MGFLSRLRNKSQVRRGRVKQRIGRATNNRRLRAEALADRIGGSAKQLGEQVKDAGNDARRSIRR
jgi:uncharacterized protein YjbJ (UPF0337 family)